MDGRRTGLLRRGEVAASRFCDMEEQALHRTQADAGWRMYYWTCSDCRTQSQNTRQACHATPITLRGAPTTLRVFLLGSEVHRTIHAR